MMRERGDVIFEMVRDFFENRSRFNYKYIGRILVYMISITRRFTRWMIYISLEGNHRISTAYKFVIIVVV